ncbi:MAG: glycoside hydrolase family 5 protein, partial [Burkholderiaceae bacterium]
VEMNRRYLSRTMGVTACLALLAALAGTSVQAQEAGCQAVTPETCALAKSLRRGVNFGNMLEAPREGDWGLKVEQLYIDEAGAAFSTVRLPVRWSNHAAPTEAATLDEVFARRIDAVVDMLLSKGVNVILDLHGYDQIYGDGLQPNEFSVNPAIVETRLINIWRQVAARYRTYPSKLVFELLNEPHGKLDGEPWNLLAPKVLAAVRESNPTRAVLIGPTYWYSVRDLPKLRMPADRNLILAIHNYDPFGFTHQGVSWIPLSIQQPGSTCCDAAQKKQITDAMDAVKRWSTTNGYPAHLGEFGAYSAAAMSSREAYTRFVRDTVEARGFGWTYWEFASSFGVYDPKAKRWIEPLRRALLD